MSERKFVLASDLDPTTREGSWICKRPSDQGPWVFVEFMNEPRRHEHYVVEITYTSRNGKSRQGKVTFVAEDVLKELMTALPHAT